MIILGAFFIYSTVSRRFYLLFSTQIQGKCNNFSVVSFYYIFQTIVVYPTPHIVTCTLRIWLREIGFALAYGALMLKTWRQVYQEKIAYAVIISQ